jgi:hypothetical protein
MHRSLAAAVATFAAMAALSAGSTAPKAQVGKCEAQRASCLEACHRGYFVCNKQCGGQYRFCRYQKSQGGRDYRPNRGPGAKQDDAKPKKGIGGTSSGTWVPSSQAKGKGVSSVPAGGTWNPPPSSGGNGPNLRSDRR